MKPDLILTADWHLREDQPPARTDDYWQAQSDAVGFVRCLAEEYSCPVVLAGDLFDNWNPSHELVAWAADNLPADLIVVPGQHDLKRHKLSLYPKTALNVLDSTGRVISLVEGRLARLQRFRGLIRGFPWGYKLEAGRTRLGHRRVAVCHTLTWSKEQPFPGADAEGQVRRVMEKLVGFHLIVTGDNHIPFIARRKSSDQILVNPGSLLRMRADQTDHKPRVYLWFAEQNDVTCTYLPIEKDVLTREHIEREEQRNERMESFVERLGEQFEVGLSFEDNMKKFLRKEKPRKKTKQYILEAMEV